MSVAAVAIIAREIELISRFVGVLKDEQEILKQGKVSDLPACTDAKADLVAQLNGLESERLSALGLDAGASGKGAMSAWLAAHPEAADIAVNWKKLMNLSREARDLHELNARLVDMHLSQTNELLAVLIQANDKTELYGSSGQTLSPTGSRIVDSA